ncbi:endonuclease V [Rhodococcus koreensis]
MNEIEYDWDLSPTEARKDQQRAKRKLVTSPFSLEKVRFVLTVGVAYSGSSKDAFVVAMPAFKDGSPVDETQVYCCVAHSEFPYIPGLYAYREGPAICKLLNSLPGLPEIIVFDAQGTAHPKGFGLAAHIGVIYDVPTLGVTRKLLTGRHDPVDSADRGRSYVRDRSGSPIGVACRFLARCEPSFASPGHRTDLATVRDYCDGIISVRGCFPSALSLVHEHANRLARKAQ